MTYLELKEIFTYEFSKYSYNYILRKRLGVDEKYPLSKILFLKIVYKVLMNQDGDETLDSLSKLEIQSIIRLFNKYCNTTIQIEYE